jgi:hypothetical protein
MIGLRTRVSLGQLLERYEPPLVSALLRKYGGPVLYQSPGLIFGQQLFQAMHFLEADAVVSLLAEVIATQGELRQRLKPHYVFDERFRDLTQCLRLDGYEVTSERTLVRLDPTLAQAPPVEDDLVRSLQASAAPSRDEIVRKINDSADAYRRTPPDYNAALTNARVALQTMARDVAQDLVPPAQSFPYDIGKWGDLLRYLRERDEISVEEERGLAGVFGFVSPGAHRAIGLSEEQMTRLGRSLALSMCWFLLQNRYARSGHPAP